MKAIRSAEQWTAITRSRELEAEGLRPAEIARSLERPVEEVWRWLHSASCPRCGWPQYRSAGHLCRECETEIRRAEVVRLWRKGLKAAEVADQTGLREAGVIYIVAEARRSDPSIRHGNVVPRPKFTAAEDERLAQLRGAGLTHREIAELMGFRRAQINNRVATLRRCGWELPKRHSSTRARPSPRAVAELWRAGLSAREIGSRLTFHTSTISSLVQTLRSAGEDLPVRGRSCVTPAVADRVERALGEGSPTTAPTPVAA